MVAAAGAWAFRRFRERASIIFVGSANEQILPATHDTLEPFLPEPLRKRNRVVMGVELDPHLPLGKTGRLRLGRLLLLTPLVLGLLLLRRCRERHARVLPFLFHVVPQIQLELAPHPVC